MMSGTGTRRGRPSPGFTLIEVLVATLLLSLGLTALLRVFAQAADSLDAASEALTGAVVVRDRLEQAREPLLMDGTPAYGSAAGQVDEGVGRVFDWRRTVTPERAQPGLSRVTVSVERAGGGRPFLAETLLWAAPPEAP